MHVLSKPGSMTCMSCRQTKAGASLTIRRTCIWCFTGRKILLAEKKVPRSCTMYQNYHMTDFKFTPFCTSSLAAISVKTSTRLLDSLNTCYVSAHMSQKKFRTPQGIGVGGGWAHVGHVPFRCSPSAAVSPCPLPSRERVPPLKRLQCMSSQPVNERRQAIYCRHASCNEDRTWLKPKRDAKKNSNPTFVIVTLTWVPFF